MGWEERNGRRYYYTKRRTSDGRVVSEYAGTGWLGALAERSDRAIQAQREAHRSQRQAALSPVDALIGHLKRLDAEARAVTAAHLLATGHRTHKGQWRKRRMFKPEPGGGVALALTPDEDTKELRALLKRCDKENPKPEDVTALRQWLRQSPKPFARALSTAALAEEAALALAVGMGSSALVREAVRLDVERFRDALGYAEADGLEALLIEQAAVCWLALQSTQKQYARLLTGEYRLSLAEHYEKRLSAVQRRFERAAETLERVRRLRRGGSVQVNVAAAGGTFQQLNSLPPPPP